MQKEITFIGLGKRGLSLAEHLDKCAYKVYGYDKAAARRKEAKFLGLTIFDTVEESVAAQAKPKTVWLMLPPDKVGEVIEKILPQLHKGDTIIDGSDTFFKESLIRHQELHEHGINFIDCGVSGGVKGVRYGASLMIGAEKEIFTDFEPLFKILSASEGYGHVGGPGAGHFAKMVHNGIEYGMMGAIAEGFNILHEHKDGLSLNILETLKPYNHGSVIDSSLMRWVGNAYHTDGYLDEIAGEVPFGDTEINMEYLAKHENTLILEAALKQRRATRKKPSFIGTLISAMQNQFGGHKTINKKEQVTTHTKTLFYS